ncbi:MAG: response regulator, partial [bacterium]
MFKEEAARKGNGTKTLEFESEFYTNSQVLSGLTANKIRDILLVSSLYNIFTLEKGGMLASQLVNEYKGLRLENPPRIHGVSSLEEALTFIRDKNFDLVLIVPPLDSMDAFSLGRKLKRIRQNIPIILLSQNAQEISSLPEKKNRTGIDHIYRWSGHSDLLLAIIKNVEDHANVSHDTARASVRVMILVEDSPDYYSHLLPILYKEIVSQIQALLEVGLTEKQRAMTLRARPKILLAKNYEEGLDLYRRYQSCLLCLISDTRLPMQGKICA